MMAEDVQFTKLRIAVNLVGKELVTELSNQLIMANKKASGNLIASLDYEIIEVLGNLMIRLKAEPYLINVDQGRRAGAKPPPVSPILKWIDLKGITPKDKDMSKRGLAFAIAKSIGNKGIKPTYVIQKARDKILQTKKEILAKAAQKDVVDALNKILRTL